jgi:hypothetical protein
MSLKRKHSVSVVDLTATSPHLPLPVPLTTRPLDPRADSPASSMSSRSSRAPKRRRRDIQVVDVDAHPEVTQPVAGPSMPPLEVIDVEVETQDWQEDDDQESDVPLAIRTKRSQSGNAVAGPSKASTHRLASSPPSGPSTPPPSNLLSSHTCPICFSTVTNACLTPCGHVLCGACLFQSVKSGIQRSLDMGIPVGGEGTAAKYVSALE